MDHFTFQNGELYAESVPVKDIVAAVGSPCYIYSRATLERHWKAFDSSLTRHKHLVCYAVKANSNLAILNLFARMGSGFDIVSAGELFRVLKSGGDASKVIFSGVGKSAEEIRYALGQKIQCFNVESEEELQRINDIAGQLNVMAPIALRVNPDVDANTHPYISTGLKENKFGIEISEAERVYMTAKQLPNIEILGVACHIGSQLTSLSPFLDALDRVLLLIDSLAQQGITVTHIDLGGGLGVRYRDENPPLPSDYAEALDARLGDRGLSIHIEPGRAIAANAGILVTKVEYLKHNAEKNFAVVDAAMNDLMRPSLYSAWQEIVPVVQQQSAETKQYDVVGPVCETGDFLGKDRALSLKQGDLLAVRSAGAYGFTMSSNYNTRTRVPEVMVDGDQFLVVRERESLDDLVRGERLLDE